MYTTTKEYIIPIIVFELVKVAATAAVKAITEYLTAAKPPDSTSK
ncbi:MAG: hypothetical protein V4454_01425 [Pseudomonadota bacterium]